MRPVAESAASDLVLHDLVDALLQENLHSIADRIREEAHPALTGEQHLESGERWCLVDVAPGAVCFRAHRAVLQPYRLSRPPVWYVEGEHVRSLAPDELARLVLAGESELPGAARVDTDLRTAVEHATVTLEAQEDPKPQAGTLLAGEALATTRGRPFHPTARAASGWTADELARYGTTLGAPVALDWIAVRRDRLRWGSDPGSTMLHEFLLDGEDRERLDKAMREVGLDERDYQPLPAHPWQVAHVLPDTYRTELESGEIVPLARGIGRGRPTSSLRTLATVPESRFHVKLPLGVSTLGAQRLLPPRYLDNGDRAQRTMRDLVSRDGMLERRVLLCAEGTWCGWQHPSGSDEFDDRPGQVSAQVRVYPEGLLSNPDVLVVPMAALAAHQWRVLSSLLRPDCSADAAVAFFASLAEAFCEMGFSFLRYGVLPELHGQNVLVTLRDGVVDRFVLRDHDALRVSPEWMAAAGVPDPGYRIKPGAPQSLSLCDPRELLGYLQTLGFQVNLFGIADALARHYGIAEERFWAELEGAVTGALARLDLPDHVADVMEDEVLRSATWPCRLVLGPMLRGAGGGGVSMPAGTGRVPNPLHPLNAVNTADQGRR